MVTGLDHYNLVAERQLLDKLQQFYFSIVGLVPGTLSPFKRFGYWLYAGAQDVLHLTEAQSNEVRQRSAVTTFDHAAFTCRDFSSVIAKLRAHGIPHHTDEVPLTGERQLLFRDPAGNGAELNCPGGPTVTAS